MTRVATAPKHQAPTTVTVSLTAPISNCRIEACALADFQAHSVSGHRLEALERDGDVVGPDRKRRCQIVAPVIGDTLPGDRRRGGVDDDDRGAGQHAADVSLTVPSARQRWSAHSRRRRRAAVVSTDVASTASIAAPAEAREAFELIARSYAKAWHRA